MPNIDAAIDPTINNLSPRELQVLAGLAADCTPKQLAASYGLSINAVRAYLARAKRKLRVSSPVAAVAEAIRRGWI
jgi:DNA-binding CsgD family transcriptional regulator